MLNSVYIFFIVCYIYVNYGEYYSPLNKIQGVYVMNPRTRDQLKRKLRGFKNIFGFFVKIILIPILFIFPLHTIPNALKAHKKALKTKQFLYNILALVFFAAYVAIVGELILALTGNIFAFFGLIVSLAIVLIVRTPLQNARANLDFFCDECGNRMDFVYNTASTNSETIHKTKEVVTGEHWNITKNADGSYDAKHIIDKEKRYDGSFTVNTSRVYVTFTCPTCGKKKEIQTSLKTYGSGGPTDKDVRKAISESILRKNDEVKHNFIKKILQ